MTQTQEPKIASFTLLTRSEGERRAAMTPEQRSQAEAQDIRSMEAGQARQKLLEKAVEKGFIHPKQWEAMQTATASKAKRKKDEEELKRLTQHYGLNFVYIREYDDEGCVKPTGGMVVAYRIPLKGGQVIEVATSLCNKADVFDKFLGKFEAAQNFYAGSVINLKVGNATTYGRAIETAFNYLINVD